MIELRDINWDNFWQVIDLKTNVSQTKYLPPISVFMAQSYVNLKLKYRDACFALYNESQLVGFAKVVYVPSGAEPYYFAENSYMIDAIMIDVKYQGKGYGKEGLLQILKYIESKPFGEAESIKLLCHGKNLLAISIYDKLGFNKIDTLIKKDGNYIIFSKDIKSIKEN